MGKSYRKTTSKRFLSLSSWHLNVSANELVYFIGHHEMFRSLIVLPVDKTLNVDSLLIYEFLYHNTILRF